MSSRVDRDREEDIDIDVDVDVFGRSIRGRPKSDNVGSKPGYNENRRQNRYDRDSKDVRSGRGSYRENVGVGRREYHQDESRFRLRDDDRYGRDYDNRDRFDRRETGLHRRDSGEPPAPPLLAPPRDTGIDLLLLPPPPPSRPEVFVPPSQMSSIPPLISYRTFVQTQRDDLPPEVYQKKYDDFQYQYILDLAEKFFHANKTEEWFRDRYDPSRIVDREKQATESAMFESETMRNALIENPIQVLEAVSLEPLILKQKIDVSVEREGNSDNPNKPVENVIPSIDGLGVSKYFPGHNGRAIFLSGIPDCCTKTQLKTAITLALSTPEANRYDTSSDVNRKSEKDIDVVTATTGTSATVEKSQLLVPERIIISSPQWNSKAHPLHERNAWVIMPTVEQTHAALKVLKNLIVSIRDHESISVELTDVMYEFTLSATMHQPRPGPVLPEFLSYGARINTDTIKAMELCNLLDEERNIPESSCFSSLLNENEYPDIAKAFNMKPYYKLDFAIAYLRRVHFVSFYGSRKHRDEAHLLTLSPSVLHRSVPYTPNIDSLEIGSSIAAVVSSAATNSNAAANVATNATAVVVASTSDDTEAAANHVKDKSSTESVSSDFSVVLPTTLVENEVTVDEKEETNEAVQEDKDRANENEEDEEDEEEDDNDSPRNRKNTEEDDDLNVSTNESMNESMNELRDETSGMTPSKSVTNTPFSSRKPGSFPLSDKRLDALIQDLRAKRLRRERASDPSKSLTRDEEDAQIIVDLQEKAFEEEVKLAAKLEGEKARCCYINCKKLFKNLEFLSKHLRSKHETFASDIMVRIAEPYMKARYDAEDLLSKPLPPIRTEVGNSIKIKTIREILDHIRPQSISGNFGDRFGRSQGGRGGLHSSNHFNGGGGSGSGRSNISGGVSSNMSRGYDNRNTRESFPLRSGSFNQDRNFSVTVSNKRGRDDFDRDDNKTNEPDRRWSSGTMNNLPPFKRQNQGNDFSKPQGKPFVESDQPVRPRSTYVDLDAPKESSIQAEYGVAILPPVKKRKLLSSAAAALKKPLT